MNKKLSLISAAVALSAASNASAQGMLSIGPRDDFETKLPFTLTVGGGIGYDSNPGAVSSNEQDSVYLQGTLGLDYNTGDRRTAYGISLEYSPFYYLDAPEGTDEFLQSARIGANWRHKASERLAFSDSLYFSYEFQPDYGIGASISRRNSQYLYGYNSFAATYAWTKRFSTVTSHTISGISYDDEAMGGEDYLSNIIGNEFRYAWSPTTTLALTYRFALTEYDNGFGDYTSHYLLTGLDHSFSPSTTGSFRVGAEIRDRDNGGSSTDPYFEGSLTHHVSKKQSLRAYTRIGFEDSDVRDSTTRYSYRVGASFQQRINTRLAGNVGAHYIHDTFEGGTSDGDNDTFALSLGLDYNIYRNLNLSTSYSFTTATGDSIDYDRHILSLGVTAQF